MVALHHRLIDWQIRVRPVVHIRTYSTTAVLCKDPYSSPSFVAEPQHLAMASLQAIHSIGVKQATNPVEYEKAVYQKGLRFERPPFTFHSQDWESQAVTRMSAESAGYLIGNAGTGETAKKNKAAFQRWSIVPKRLVKTERLPDLSTRVLAHDLQFPVAIAPVGVQRMSSNKLIEQRGLILPG
jgi:hypothetical protein